MKKIIISNIKSIKSLEFVFPGPGLFLLTGKNGCGKTTLMAAIHRIGFSNAFRNNFISTKDVASIDSFDSGKIEYIVGKGPNDSVTYAKSKNNWTPRPKKNSRVLKRFGFSSIDFIKADSKRVSPSEKEIREGRKKKLSEDLIKSICFVLGDDKYMNLRKLKVQRGKSKEVLLMLKSKNNYYSEKNFSLGELSIIKTLETVRNAKRNSLILIDEAEIALHPQVQYRLIKELSVISSKKEQTIILCTHSATIIKNMKKKQILYMENNNGEITLHNPCYPARVLESLAYNEDIMPDVLYAVEDKMANYLLHELIEQSKSINPEKTLWPYYQTIPIGTADSVISFAINSKKGLLPQNTRVFAILDQDQEIQHNNLKHKPSSELKNGELKLIDKLNNHTDIIRYFPITPETGVVMMLCNNPYQHNLDFKNITGYDIDFSLILNSQDSFNQRTVSPNNHEAKLVFEKFINELVNKYNLAPQDATRWLFKYYAKKGITESKLNRWIGAILI